MVRGSNFWSLELRAESPEVAVTVSLGDVIQRESEGKLSSSHTHHDALCQLPPDVGTASTCSSSAVFSVDLARPGTCQLQKRQVFCLLLVSTAISQIGNILGAAWLEITSSPFFLAVAGECWSLGSCSLDPFPGDPAPSPWFRFSFIITGIRQGWVWPLARPLA